MKDFPLNQYFPFLVLSIVSIGMACFGMLLSKAVDTKKWNEICL